MKKSLLVMAAMLVFTGIAYADSITVKSGNAAIGQYDPKITVCGKQIVFGGHTVTAAPAGPQQAIVMTPNSAWTSLEGSSWVGPIQDDAWGGYSYKIEFLLPLNFTQPSMTVAFTADNSCSTLLNGTLIGTTPTTPKPYAHQSIYYTNASNLSLFHQGSNILEFEVMNGDWGESWGGPTGLLFSANINYVVPEPSSILVLAIGFVPLGFMFRRK